ncbi:hypothetical protein evm_010442 [Chilo suppressalis]|nr:hypothetical protein evm_010442 [Chilo suppressalis]
MMYTFQINNGKKLLQADISSDDLQDRNSRQSSTPVRKNKHVRSFSSFDISSCECHSILLAAYSQIIDHCRGAGEYEKLFEAYLEYADLNIINQNIPQAIRLLFEVETFVLSGCLSNKRLKWDWIKKFRLASIYTLRGECMLYSGDIVEARKYLLYAMELYHDPFPTSKHSVQISNFSASVKQRLELYFASHCYVGMESGMVGRFYEDIARTLSSLYTLFSETKENSNAKLAAKCSLNYALKTNTNFRAMCNSYGSMITIYRQNRQFSMCHKLEQRAIELCHRKRGQIDVREVPAVSYLYTSIFLFYVEHGKKTESLEFGLSVMHMLSTLTDTGTCHMLVMWMLKLLLSDLRIHDMVNTMRQFFYMPDHYGLSSETWYYFYATIVMLDTGYYVETYGTCERFYLKKGDAILRARTPEAAWSFFVGMWLVTVRVGTWERSILWEEKIRQIVAMKFENDEYNMMILMRLAEGLVITLVKEMDNRNIKAIFVLEKTLKAIFQDMYTCVGYMTMFKPRYYFLYAYFHYVRGKKYRGFSYLNKCIDYCKQLSLKTLLIWAKHTLNHWKGTLNPTLENYWVEHVEPEQTLDYRDFDLGKSKIVPYTLPLPRDFEMYNK